MGKFTARHAVKIAVFLSFLALYDVVGDVTFLVNFVLLPYRAHVSIRDLTTGITQCNSYEYPYVNATLPHCLPGSDTPINMLFNYTDYWSDIETSLDVAGHTCDSAYRQATYSGNKIFQNLDKCLKLACADCLDSCNILTFDSFWGLDPDYVSVSNRPTHDQSTHNNGIGIMTCHYNLIQDVSQYNIPAIVILVVIIVKETIKIILCASYFFTPFGQTNRIMKFTVNSIISWIFLLASEKFRQDVKKMKLQQSKNESRRTLAILIDLFLEDLPQLYLPIWFIDHQGTADTLTIISLSGSILMSLKSLLMLLKYLYMDFKDTMGGNGQTQKPSSDVHVADSVIRATSTSQAPSSPGSPQSIGQQTDADIGGSDSKLDIDQSGTLRIDNLVERVVFLESQLERISVLETDRTAQVERISVLETEMAKLIPKGKSDS